MKDLLAGIGELVKLTYPETEIKNRLVSNCCKAYAKNHEEIINDVCSKCGEHCDYIKESEIEKWKP